MTGALAGVKPVVVAIVVEAILKIGDRALKRRAHLALAAAAFVAIYFLQVPFPLIVLAAGIIGLLGERLWPQMFAVARLEGNSKSPAPRRPLIPTVIDDEAPPLAHTLVAVHK